MLHVNVVIFTFFQVREDELKSLRVQPLTDNMWLKRSLSDPSLPEVDTFILFAYVMSNTQPKSCFTNRFLHFTEVPKNPLAPTSVWACEHVFV